jgi:hypothetical protein
METGVLRKASLAAGCLFLAPVFTACGSGSAVSESSPSSEAPASRAPSRSASSDSPTEGRTFGPRSVAITGVEDRDGSLMIELRGPGFEAVHWRSADGAKTVCGDSSSGDDNVREHVIQCAGVRPPGVLLPSVDSGDFSYEFEVDVKALTST